MKYTWLVTLSMMFALLVTTGPVAFADDEKPSDSAATQSDTEEKKEDAKKDKEEEKDAKKDSDKDKDDEKAKKPEAKKPEAKKSEAKKSEAKKPERKTHKVETAEIQADFTTAGIFVARNMTEVELKPEAWGTWKIEHVVPHGSRVKQGEVLVRFESKNLKEAIEELDLELRLNELSIIKAEAELPQVEKHIQFAFESAERALEDARREYKDYTQGDRDRLVKSIDLRLKSSRQQAENVREELRQLEKMYEADDLTEETEEIVLKRQRVAAEMADFMLESAKISHERTLERALPRNDLEQREALERVEMAYERAKTALQTDVSRARYELEKAKRTRTKALKKHADLTKDLNLLTIKAPAEGVVYYGNCTDGNWSNTAALIGKLKKEATAPANSILMTIVELRPMYVVSTVGEAQRPSVEKGQQATIAPTGDEKQEIKAKVSDVSAIPVGPGKFSLELELEGEDQPEWLVPGMTGKAKVVTYLNKKAIVVPKGAIREDKEKDEKFVWLVDGKKVSKKTVKVGKAKDDKVEITEGLAEGDVISLDDEQKKRDEAKAAKEKAAKEAKEKKESDKADDKEKSKDDDTKKDDKKEQDDKKEEDSKDD